MHYYFSTHWAFCNETCILRRNMHFFIHRQSTQFTTIPAFSNARGNLHLATNHVIVLYLHSNAHLMFFQRNVHFCNDTCISQRNTHFALKRAFCDETRILHWNVHFATKHAFLSLPRIFRGCIIQSLDVVYIVVDISTQCRWQQVRKNVDIRKHRLLFALEIDGLSMLKWHAHARNENIHIPSHTSSRS